MSRRSRSRGSRTPARRASVTSCRRIRVQSVFRVFVFSWLHLALMLLSLKTCDVRSWEVSDVDSLTRHADNRKIWLNLRDAFPHPYTKHNAREFIRATRQRTPETLFAIAVSGDAIGGIGFVLHPDVER